MSYQDGLQDLIYRVPQEKLDFLLKAVIHEKECSEFERLQVMGRAAASLMISCHLFELHSRNKEETVSELRAEHTVLFDDFLIATRESALNPLEHMNNAPGEKSFAAYVWAFCGMLFEIGYDSNHDPHGCQGVVDLLVRTGILRENVACPSELMSAALRVANALGSEVLRGRKGSFPEVEVINEDKEMALHHVEMLTGFRFHHTELVYAALTHSSSDRKFSSGARISELQGRLAFLGLHVLNYAISGAAFNSRCERTDDAVQRLSRSVNHAIVAAKC